MTGGSCLNYACLEIVKNFARYTFLLATLFIQLKVAKEANRDETQYTVRLVNGEKPWLGRVEVYYNGQWGTVCDDDWTIEDASVVCRQLEFDGTLAAYTRAKFGQGQTLPILLDNAGCMGYESRIQDCSGNWGEDGNNCDHSEDAGVECQAGLHADKTEVLFTCIRIAASVCCSITIGILLYRFYQIWFTNDQPRRRARRNTHPRNTQPAAPSHNLNTSTVENISVPSAPPAASVPLSTARPPPDGDVSMTVPSSTAQDLPPSYDDVVMEDLETFVPPPGKNAHGWK